MMPWHNGTVDIAWGCKRLSTKLITKEGHEALKKSWITCGVKSVRIPRWQICLPKDRSENADYQYNKKAVARDRPTRALPANMRWSTCPSRRERCWPKSKRTGRDQRCIVGYDEIYDRMDYISIDSPMASGLAAQGGGMTRHRTDPRREVPADHQDRICEAGPDGTYLAGRHPGFSLAQYGGLAPAHGARRALR